MGLPSDKGRVRCRTKLARISWSKARASLLTALLTFHDGAASSFSFERKQARLTKVAAVRDPSSREHFSRGQASSHISPCQLQGRRALCKSKFCRLNKSRFRDGVYCRTCQKAAGCWKRGWGKQRGVRAHFLVDFQGRMNGCGRPGKERASGEQAIPHDMTARRAVWTAVARRPAWQRSRGICLPRHPPHEGRPRLREQASQHGW